MPAPLLTQVERHERLAPIGGLSGCPERSGLPPWPFVVLAEGIHLRQAIAVFSADQRSPHSAACQN